MDGSRPPYMTVMGQQETKTKKCNWYCKTMSSRPNFVLRTIRTSENPRYKDWFPMNEEIDHDLRKRRKFREECIIHHTKTERPDLENEKNFERFKHLI